jgi:malonyl-CoA O-methyltransferase
MDCSMPPADRPPGSASGIDPRAVRRHFARAATTYDAAAALQREVGTRMAERLDVVRLQPRRMLDAGCGTGEALGEFAARYPTAKRFALDLALPMLERARAKAGEQRSLVSRLLAPLTGQRAAPPVAFACGDISSLPFAARSFDLVWSNLALQWVPALPVALAELLRVLDVGGLLMFTTFGPDTLKELRAVFAEIDGEPHVSRFVDLHDVGDLLLQAGFADPVVHMECFTLTYADPLAMLRDLKAIGATNSTHDRARGLMGRARWSRALAGLDRLRLASAEQKVPATYEVVYGHAWKAAPRTTADGRAIVDFVARPRGAPRG